MIRPKRWRPITQGRWEVRTLNGVDERTRSAFFSGTERSHIGSDAYRIGLDGKNDLSLTPDEFVDVRLSEGRSARRCSGACVSFVVRP